MSNFVSLSDLAEINPVTHVPSGISISFVGMEDVSEQFELLRTHDRSASDGYTRFREGDILFAKITPCMENGKGAVALGLRGGYGFGSTEFHVLRPRVPESRGFIAQWLQSQYLRNAAEGQMTGTAGQRRVPKEFFSRLQVPEMSVAEQQRISEILETLDEQIRATERIIEKLKLQAEGLADDIVGRALERASCGEDGWSWTSLGMLLDDRGGFIQTGPFGSQLHAYDYVDEGVPVVMPQDMKDGRISLDSVARITEEKAKGLARHRMLPGDVVFARRGNLERCAEITSREESWLCGTGCLLVRTPPAVLMPSWLALVYRHVSGQRHVRAHAVGSTMPNLNGGILSSLPLPLPPISQQEGAAELVSVQARLLSDERLRLGKLQAIKSGLSRDLLTGRIRVSGGDIS